MDAPPPPPTDRVPRKCLVRGCKADLGDLLSCRSCKRPVHLSCFLGAVLMNGSLDDLPDGGVVCSKGCYKKAFKEDTTSGSWTSDGKGGLKDPINSMNILIDWWTTEGNYVKYAGKNNFGVKKIEVCRKLAERMTRMTKSTRTAKGVWNKISYIERKMRIARKYHKESTGAGLTGGADDNGAETMNEKLETLCPNYFQLLPIMLRMSSLEPQISSDEMDRMSSTEINAILQGSGDDTSENVPDGTDDGSVDSVPRSINTVENPKRNASNSTVGSAKKARKQSPSSIVDEENDTVVFR